MNRRRKAHRFLGVLVVLGLLAMWPWDALERGYGKAFVAVSNVVIGWTGGDSGILGSRGAALLVADYDGSSQHDILLGVQNLDRRGPEGLGRSRISSRHLGYLPTATFLVLVLATPVSLRRRLVALAVGLPAILGFVAIRFSLILLAAFEGAQPHSRFLLVPPWDEGFAVLVNIASAVPATTYLVPLVLWGALTIRREDLD